MKPKQRNGRAYYDREHDILIFKTTRIEYRNSLQYRDYVIDIGKWGVLSGMRIFDASKLLCLSKTDLVHMRKWAFDVEVGGGNMDLLVDIMTRNKVVKQCHVW